MNTTPFTYQLEDVRTIHRMGGRTLVSLEMGLGKTLEALLYAHRHPDIRPMVVVCPASLKYMWEDQAWEHFNIRADVLEGTKPPPFTGLKRNSDLTIVNYDILGQRRDERSGEGWLNYLTALQPKLVIIDECHMVATRGTLRTKSVQRLCQGVPHVLALSGTPLVNRPIELWPILNILRPDLFSNYWAFCMRYCGAKRTRWGWDLSGSSHLDELHTLLNQVMIRRLKSEVLTQLPAKRRSVIPLEISNKSEYDLAKRDFILWLKQNTPKGVMAAKRAEGLSKLGTLKRIAAKLKLPSVISWVENFLKGSEEKLILFAYHRNDTWDIIPSLHKKFEKVSVVLDGSVSQSKRKLVTEKFLSDKKTRILIGQIRAAGVGWSAPGVSNVAFAEFDWVPGTHAQAEDRVHGINRGVKDTPSLVHYLVGKGTIEEELVKLLQRKQKTLDKVLDGSNETEFDIYDKLCASLLKEEEL